MHIFTVVVVAAVVIIIIIMFKEKCENYVFLFACTLLLYIGFIFLFVTTATYCDDLLLPTSIV